MSDLGYNPSSPKKEYTGIKTIRSLTIKQVLSAEHEDGSTVIYVDNKELSTLKIIGWVYSVKSTNSGKTFIVEDGTGEIECMLWANRAYEEYMASFIEDGILVRIVGTLKEFLGKKNITVSNIYVVEDYNELLYHMITAVKDHLSKKEILNKEDMHKIHRDILECIRNNQDDDTGLDIKIIIKCLQNEYSERMIRESLEYLVDNCHLVITNDDGYKTVN